MHSLKNSNKSENRYWRFVGLIALLWLILRSAENPKRLMYPCQRAALPLAVNWILSLLAFITGSIFIRKFAKISAAVILFIGIVWFTFTLTEHSNADPSGTARLPVWEVSNPTSKVFVLDSIPQTKGSLASGDATVPDSCLSDPAIDTLCLMLASKGTYIHKTITHPDGIVGSNDVVIIKGNFQWSGKVSTSTDRIKGLIWQVLKHPNGFTGDIIVCDNTQYQSNSIGHNDNNSEDTSQSIIDVVNTFHAKGYPVYILDWKYMNTFDGLEYSQGDYRDCYIYNAQTKVSYPKFRSPSGKHLISLRYGIWDSLTASYNSSRLCIINFPVLKHHSMSGATVAVKNWIGVMSTDRPNERYGGWDPMHYTYLFSQYALVARIMAVTYPRLSIVDAAWTSRWGNITPDQVTNTKVLLASTDPVSVSWYAAKYVLTPIASRPTETDPDLPGGKYHTCLANWTTFLHDSAGLACTMDSNKISVYGRESLIPTALPTTPMLLSPANGATNQHTALTLNWNASVYASFYHLKISLDSNFSNLLINDSTLTQPTYFLEYLLNTTTYYWHVCAKNNLGSSEYSSTWKFTTGNLTTLAIQMNSGWNMISLPLLGDDSTVNNLFPTATSDAYAYIAGNYLVKDTLRNGQGFWLKFNDTQSVIFYGLPHTIDTIDVVAGWNLIGLLSNPVLVNSINTIPAGIIIGDIFGYQNSYTVADTLEPAKAYWVKVSENGKMILEASAVK
jgi:hypothetical protein